MEKELNHPPINFGKTGALIINLGTPDSTSWFDIRKYLKEFLSDKRVIEVNPFVWQIILNVFILNLRPSKTAKAYKEIWMKDKNISLSNMYVDNAAMQLVRDPGQFDVILTSNLFGDILSDLAAMLTGSIGMLPSASLNNNGPGVFEPVHGSAPDIAGKNIANPIAMLLSASMMLKIGLNEEKAAENLETAIDKVLSKGFRTADLADGSSEVLSCSEIGDRIMDEI